MWNTQHGKYWHAHTLTSDGMLSSSCAAYPAGAASGCDTKAEQHTSGRRRRQAAHAGATTACCILNTAYCGQVRHPTDITHPISMHPQQAAGITCNSQRVSPAHAGGITGEAGAPHYTTVGAHKAAAGFTARSGRNAECASRQRRRRCHACAPPPAR